MRYIIIYTQLRHSQQKWMDRHAKTNKHITKTEIKGTKLIQMFCQPQKAVGV